MHLANCLYEVCCPPRSEGAVRALAEEMAKNFAGDGSALDSDTAIRDIAEWVLDNFDLAPKGSLQALKDSVRDLAREGYVKA